MGDLVKNAADETQVKEARSKEKLSRKTELSDLRVILSMQEGRRFLWRMLEQCRTFESIWEPSAKIHYLAGRQDLGHFVMAEIIEANDEALLQMQREHKEEKSKNG